MSTSPTIDSVLLSNCSSRHCSVEDNLYHHKSPTKIITNNRNNNNPSSTIPTATTTTCTTTSTTTINRPPSSPPPDLLSLSKEATSVSSADNNHHNNTVIIPDNIERIIEENQVDKIMASLTHNSTSSSLLGAWDENLHPNNNDNSNTSNNNTTHNDNDDQCSVMAPKNSISQPEYEHQQKELTNNNNDLTPVAIVAASQQQEGTKKFRSKAFLVNNNAAATSCNNNNNNTKNEQQQPTNSVADHSSDSGCNNNSSSPPTIENSSSIILTNEPSTTVGTITTTKQVDPYSLVSSMRSNNQQTETGGKRKSSSSSSSSTVDTITYARKLVSGFGISTKDSKIDLLYATTLSSVSNSGHRKKQTTKKTSDRFLFCKYCKLSNKSLDSGRLDFKRCSLCREVRYCCKEHQVADWPKHKFECNCAVRALNNGTYSKLLQKGDETNRPQIGDSVSVHYVAKLLNDTIVDKTYKSIETNQHCNVSYDTSDDEEGEEGFDDDKDLYIVKPPSNSYNDFEQWLSHANNKYLLKQRKSDVGDDSDDEISSTSSSSNNNNSSSSRGSEVYDRNSVASSFSDLSFATSCTDSTRMTLSQRTEDDTSLYSSISSSKLPPKIINNEPEDAEDNWSTDSSGRGGGGGTSSSTSTVSIIFDSVSKDIEVVPDLLQFTLGKGQVSTEMEKHLCQMSLGERRYVFVSPKSRQPNSNQDILSKRVKKLSDFTVIYEIMIVQILRKKDENENHHLRPSPQPTTCAKPIYGQDEFTKGNETYQSCFYEPFRRFIPSL